MFELTEEEQWNQIIESFNDPTQLSWPMVIVWTSLPVVGITAWLWIMGLFF